MGEPLGVKWQETGVHLWPSPRAYTLLLHRALGLFVLVLVGHKLGHCAPAPEPYAVEKSCVPLTFVP
jgi:hypothetical protein